MTRTDPAPAGLLIGLIQQARSLFVQMANYIFCHALYNLIRQISRQSPGKSQKQGGNTMAKKIEASGLGQVRAEDRKSWLSIAFIWAGSVCCVPALMVGAGITMGLSFAQAAVAMCLGYGICVVLMILMSILSADKGIPTVSAASSAFGKTGSGYLVSAIIAFCFICWFGFQAVICGEAFAAILNSFGIPLPGIVSTFLWGLLMCLTAVVGINLIRLLNIVSVPALILILIYAMISVFRNPGSAAAISGYTPATVTPMVAAIGTAVGGFATGSVLSGDTTRYCRSRKDVIISSIVGVIPMGVGTMLAGGVLAIHSGSAGMDTTSIVNMLSSIGAPILGLLVLVLATWTTNVSNAYSAGFALLSLTKGRDDRRWLYTLIAGVLGTLLSVFGITNYFNSFLNILAAFIPPVAGVVVMDYFVIHKGDPDRWEAVEGVNWTGIIAWVGGALFALAFPTLLVPTINGVVVACVLYLILHPILTKSRKTA